ncbi:MAG: S24/S26 family peptidase [Clostridia bacterium]|nr:S24/S26 family peptidase [Clostridia bacterium]
MKEIDTTACLTAMRELTEAGHTVSVQVSGNSMAPFLRHGRDIVWFKKPERPLRVGDVVFFCRTSGQFVLHRICRIRDGAYYIVGDNQTWIEGPVQAGQIFAVVVQVRRKGKILRPSHPLWCFFAVVWVRMIFARKFIAQLYRWMHKGEHT